MAHRNVGDGNFAPRLRRPDQTWNFARKFNPRPFAKTKTANVFVEFLIAESDGKFGRADVARFHENVFDAEVGERGMIVERRAAVVPNALLAKDVGIESELVLVERGCRRDDFE